MITRFWRTFLWLVLLAAAPAGFAQEQAAPPPAAAPAPSAAAANEAADATVRAQAGAAVAGGYVPRPPDFLEHVVDSILHLFDIGESGNTPAHLAVSALLLVIALLARRIVTRVVFTLLRKVASKTASTLDDKIFVALEPPAAALIMVVGIFAALKVLKLEDATDLYIANGSQVAFSLTIFWGLWRTLGALLDHGSEIARHHNSGISAFMPWIKKTFMVVFAVVGVLTIIQNLGFDVKTLLAGLGIGGLAFALAAQDTLANVFGAVVVAIDQPFKIGEVVRIQGNVGFIEDIGVRSTRIRLIDKSLMVIPNKTVAAETITNLSRFTRRRFEQVIGLTYDTKPEQMDEMVAEIRRIITAQPEVDAPGVMVFFRDFSASSLDIWVVYECPDPDFQKAMLCKQRINLEIMRAVEARGLSFAFPTQTVQLAGEVAEKLAARGAPTDSVQPGKN